MKKKLRLKNKYRKIPKVLHIYTGTSCFSRGDILGFQGVGSVYRVHKIRVDKIYVFKI